MCEFLNLGPIISIYKYFTWWALCGKTAFPTPAWCKASAFQSLKGGKVKDSAPLASHAVTHIYIPSPSTFSQRPFCLGLSLRPPQMPLSRHNYWGTEGEFWKHLSLLWLSTQFFSTPSSFPFSFSWTQDQKTVGFFCWGLPWQWNNPYIFADAPDLWIMCWSLGENTTWGSWDFSGSSLFLVISQ